MLRFVAEINGNIIRVRFVKISEIFMMQDDVFHGEIFCLSGFSEQTLQFVGVGLVEVISLDTCNKVLSTCGSAL